MLSCHLCRVSICHGISFIVSPLSLMFKCVMYYMQFMLYLSMPIGDTCINCSHMILYFTQVNKVLARSLGVCLEENVMVLMATHQPPPPFFTKLQQVVSCHGGRTCSFGYLNQSQPNTQACAKGCPHGHHFHHPW